MSTKAKEVVNMLMDSLDLENSQNQWNFLNTVSMGINENGVLDYEQSNLLEAVLSHIVCIGEEDRLSNPLNSMLLAIQIATWVNSASLEA